MVYPCICEKDIGAVATVLYWLMPIRPWSIDLHVYCLDRRQILNKLASLFLIRFPPSSSSSPSSPSSSSIPLTLCLSLPRVHTCQRKKRQQALSSGGIRPSDAASLSRGLVSNGPAGAVPPRRRPSGGVGSVGARKGGERGLQETWWS